MTPELAALVGQLALGMHLGASTDKLLREAIVTAKQHQGAFVKPHDKTSDLTMPEDLNEAGRRAYEIIVAYLKERGLTDTGGCKVFYSPTEWSASGHEYGARSHLIIAYEKGTMGPVFRCPRRSPTRAVFSMDAAYRRDCAYYTGKKRELYALHEGMQEKLHEAGLYFEPCTYWYSGV